MKDIRTDLKKCNLCQERFSVTATTHRPKPIVWFQTTARILIAGQAPGMKVHKSGKPFSDPSGDRLRGWLGMDDDMFYDQARVAIIPMAFCFPGYNAKGSDLPPPPICAKTWRGDALAMVPDTRLTILIGGHAMRYHLPDFTTVTQAVLDWESIRKASLPCHTRHGAIRVGSRKIRGSRLMSFPACRPPLLR